MSKRYSLYLDLLRLIAAILVVLAHFCQHGFVSAAIRPYVPELGREAVVLFFVLSGFVIAYATAEKSVGVRQYIVARCARIFSVAAPILLLAFLLVLALQWIAPAGAIDFQVARWYVYLPMHLSFAGELWNISLTPPLLASYWSLGFEVWYYVLFGAVIYARGWVRALLCAAILLVMGHKLWLLLPVWLSGAYLYAYQKQLPIGRTAARIGCLLTIAALFAFQACGAGQYLRSLGNAIWPFHGLALGSADRYLADYAVCAIVYLHFVFARQADLALLERMQKPIRAIAAYTFTLYLVHPMVMELWKKLCVHDNTSAWDIAALAICIGLASYLLGLVTEHRKTWFQQIFNTLIGAMLDLRTRAGVILWPPAAGAAGK